MFESISVCHDIYLVEFIYLVQTVFITSDLYYRRKGWWDDIETREYNIIYYLWLALGKKGWWDGIEAREKGLREDNKGSQSCMIFSMERQDYEIANSISIIPKCSSTMQDALNIIFCTRFFTYVIRR